MEYQTFYSVSESSISFGFWFSITIACAFLLIGSVIIFKRPSEVIFGNNRVFHFLWGIFAIIFSSFMIYFLINKILTANNDLAEGNFNIVTGQVTDFRFIKRSSDFAEFTIDTGKKFRTSGLSSQVPRSGFPVGTTLRISYNIEKNDILKLEIETQQFIEINKQLEKYRYECFHYAKC